MNELCLFLYQQNTYIYVGIFRSRSVADCSYRGEVSRMTGVGKMDPQHITRQSTPAQSQPPSYFLALAGLVEVVVACVMVVGFFAAASERSGWSSALQLGACGVLGGLLWFADRTLVKGSPAFERTAGGRAAVSR
jgi:hypothetical protein